MTDVRTGGCFCGAVRFETEGAPRFLSLCHCESCRRAHAAPSVAWAGFREAQVRLRGETIRVYPSSPGVERSFCGACGSPLAYRGEKWPGETHLPICAFDLPGDMAPTEENRSPRLSHD
jgi:hypothetical protein